MQKHSNEYKRADGLKWEISSKRSFRVFTERHYKKVGWAAGRALLLAPFPLLGVAP